MPKKKKPATGVTLSWDKERYPNGPPIGVLKVGGDFKKNLDRQKLGPEHARELSNKASKKRTARANAPCKCCELTRREYWDKKRSQLEESIVSLVKSPDRLADEATAKHFGIKYLSMYNHRDWSYKKVKPPSRRSVESVETGGSSGPTASNS